MNEKKKQRVFLLDSSEPVRRSLGRLIEQAGPFRVVGEATSAEDAWTHLRRELPDILVMDLQFQDGDGLGLIREWHALWPGLPILVVSLHEASVFQGPAREAGARGYLMKQQASSKVLEALEAVGEGREWFGLGV